MLYRIPRRAPKCSGSTLLAIDNYSSYSFRRELNYTERAYKRISGLVTLTTIWGFIVRLIASDYTQYVVIIYRLLVGREVYMLLLNTEKKDENHDSYAHRKLRYVCPETVPKERRHRTRRLR